MPTPKILITIEGGVATVVCSNSKVEVHVIDYDDLKMGDTRRCELRLEPETPPALCDQSFAESLRQAKQEALEMCEP